MKKHRIIAIILISAMVSSFAACGGSGNSSGGNDEKTYNLTYSYFGPASIGPGLFITQAAENIAKKTDGRLTIDCYFDGTLLTIWDTLVGCINGVADLVYIDATVLSEGFALNNVFSMPFLNTPPGKAATDLAYAQLIKDCPELSAELEAAGVMWLSIATIGGYHLFSTEVLDSPAKLSGKTIEGIGEGGRIINALGGNGVVLDLGDFYMSLSTGLLNGILVMIGELHAFGLYEIVDKHIIFSNSTDVNDHDAMWGGGLYSPPMGMIINTNSFNELPADLQQVLLDEIATLPIVIPALDTDDIIIPAIDFITSRGDEFFFINNEARQEWSKSFGPVLETWYDRCDAAGYDGRAVYNHLLELFDK